MHGPVYDVEPGAEYLIPFARKRLAQTLARTTPGCPFLRARVFDNGSDTADIEAGRFVSRVRMRGGRPWYFSVRDSGPLVDGVRAYGVSFGGLEDVSLARVSLGATGGTDRWASVRALGKSTGLLLREGADAQVLHANGRLDRVPDPGHVFSEAASFQQVFQAAGMERPAFAVLARAESEVPASSIVFTDGNVVEQATFGSTPVLGAGVCVAGGQPYYYGVTFGAVAYWLSAQNISPPFPTTPGVWPAFVSLVTGHVLLESPTGTREIPSSALVDWDPARTPQNITTYVNYPPNGIAGTAAIELEGKTSFPWLITGTRTWNIHENDHFSGAVFHVEDTPEYIELLSGGSGFWFRLYRAAAQYPVASDGSFLPAPPPSAVEAYLLTDAAFVSVGAAIATVATNDYDVMTVLARRAPAPESGSPPPSGAIEIRIGHALVWSSPGTATGPNIGSNVNSDDVAAVSVLGDQGSFFVVLVNLAAFFQLYRSGELVAPFPTALFRLLKFTRGEDGGYSTVETTMVLPDVQRIGFDACVSPAGFRAFLQILQMPGGALPWRSSAGWLGEDMVFAEVYRSDSFLSGSTVSVLPVQSGAAAVFIPGNVWVVAFSHSAGNTYVETHPLGSEFGNHTTRPTVLFGEAETNGQNLYVLARVSVPSPNGYMSLLGSDGAVQEVPWVGGAALLNLAVDESSRKIHSLRAGPTSVVRYDHTEQTLTEFQTLVPEEHFRFGLALPSLAEHYRNRLLRQWAAEDEALESGGG